ncbi:FAD-dependent oxidoreductase [Agrococcus beijingensis]|uniref:FAD-dependent oxidoreductase n=1 Tax=Agrococcus beijingensis TaxID=3068634 RepID=UPI0027426222|nr:FAD-dependent oxidoreductase [Agrococcus sp. REN33]
MNRSILVVGGGIGGLATAIALRANAGFDVTVIEKHADVHSSVWGVGIIQPANAMRALDAIGCAEACMADGYGATEWGSMYDVDGNLLFDMKATKIEGGDYPAMNGITRPRLHEILTSRALEVGVEIVYSTDFVSLEQGASGVTVHASDGRERRFDLVVGADGVRSVVRNHVLDEELRPYYIGQSAFRVNMPRLPEIDRILLQPGPGGMAGFVPIGKDLAYFFLNIEVERDQRPKGDDVYPALVEKLKGFNGLTGRFRDEFLEEGADIVIRPEESLISPAPWHRGRVVLIGDAVHTVTPHLGQGAAQAIEDGIVLAEELAKNDDFEAAFDAYTERRYERCKLVVDTCLAIAEWEKGKKPGFDNIAATNLVLDTLAQPY